jgi:hypothetical protein
VLIILGSITDFALPLGLLKTAILLGLLTVKVWLGLRATGALDLTEESSPGKKKESAILDFFKKSSSYYCYWIFWKLCLFCYMVGLDGFKLIVGTSMIVFLPI